MLDKNLLASIPLFSALSNAQLEELAKLWTPIHKEKNAVIFNKDDAGQSIFFITNGLVKISTQTNTNKEIVLTTLSKGDFFGELALFDNSPRAAKATAIEQTELFAMQQHEFHNFLHKYPASALVVLSVLGKRLKQTNQLIEQNYVQNANEIIAEHTTLGDRAAERIAKFAGSWGFILTFLSALILWVIANTIIFFLHAFDPYPFILLNLTLSCMAAFQAPIILMAQNRQSKKDRLSAELDYKINLKSELQIQSLHAKIDALRTLELTALQETQENQQTLLEKQNEMLEKIIGKSAN